MSCIITDSVISITRLAGVEARVGEVARDLVDELGSLQLPGREVHRHVDGWRPRVALLQILGLRARFAQHPVPDRDDEAGLLGERHEVERRREAALGMLPAHERFERLRSRRSRSTMTGW